MGIFLKIDRDAVRVGNLIWNTYYNRAEILSAEGYTNIMQGTPHSYTLKGIKLSPGWCENIGGAIHDNDQKITTYAFSGSSGRFIIYFDGHQAYMMIDSLRRDIHTVHQLQNIVYYLLDVTLVYTPPKMGG